MSIGVSFSPIKQVTFGNHLQPEIAGLLRQVAAKAGNGGLREGVIFVPDSRIPQLMYSTHGRQTHITFNNTGGVVSYIDGGEHKAPNYPAIVTYLRNLVN